MKHPQLRTNIYVDGFNLYYGSLKSTPYKWLNLKILFDNLLNADHTVQTIKYFTAKIAVRAGERQSQHNQLTYLSALNTIPEVDIFYGHYLMHKVYMPLVENPNKLVQVYKTEEKGSDVNLAVHMLNDACQNRYDCAVLVSNDSDMAESLRLIKSEYSKKIGLVTPGSPKERRTSRELAKHADFIKRIRNGVLKISQLPNTIPDTVLHKPSNW